MRLGVVLDGPCGPALVAEAAAADRIGLDLVWITAVDRHGARRDATVVAAALARVVRDAAVVVEADPGHHPLELAEKLAVTDLLLHGRVTVAFTGPVGAPGPGGGDGTATGIGNGAGTDTGADTGGGVPADRVAEGIEVALAGLSPVPFRHAGRYWTFPAPGSEDRLRVTPAPAQLAMGTWAVGSDLAAVAERYGLRPVATEDEELAAVELAAAEAAGDGTGPPTGPPGRPGSGQAHIGQAHIGQVRIGQPRIARRRFDVPADPGPQGTAAVAEVVAALSAERDRAGLGICAVRLPDAPAGHRLGAIEVLGSRVRPQLLLPHPDGDLVDSWSLPASAHLEDPR